MKHAFLGGLLAGGCASSGVQQGYFFGHDLRKEQSVVYVLDMSGSMREASGTIVEEAGAGIAAEAAGQVVGGLLGSGAGHAAKSGVEKLREKLEKVKLHLIASLNGLPPGSTFNIVLFSDGVLKLSPEMVPVSPATVGLVSAFVAQLEAGGSTNMFAAVEAGLYAGGHHVILLADGLPTSSTPQEILELAARCNGNHQFVISTVGVGADQAREFLHQLAAQNSGSYTSYD